MTRLMRRLFRMWTWRIRWGSTYGRGVLESKYYVTDHPCSPFEHTCDHKHDDLECSACGARDCPDNEPGHYWHDGCPSCWFRENVK